MESGYFATDSIVRVGCNRTDGMVWRKLVVIREARLRDAAVRECAGADEATARSAHSAVATTITAITCLVRRIDSVEEKIGQSIEMPPVTVKATAAGGIQYYPVRPAVVRQLDMADRRIIWYSYRELGVYVGRRRTSARSRCN